MRTQSLFHFTKNRDVLFSILEHGFWPHYSYEDIAWVSGTLFFGRSMVCFCDIALPKLENHTSFYGKFGIGMKKDWGIDNGLNPLMYVSGKSEVCGAIQALFANPHPEVEDSKRNILNTLAYMKPLKGKMKVGDEVIEKDFYEECEWRYVETDIAGIFPSEDPNQLAIENANANNYSLKFKPEDIRYLLVESEQDVTPLIDFINSKLIHFSNNELKILTTKIIVLDDLKADI